MKNLFTTLVLVLMTSYVWSQGMVKGTILDEDSGEPLIGASVLVQGSSNGTTTDVDGKFMLANLETGNATLVVSYTGYTNMEKSINIKDGENDLGTMEMSFNAVGLAEIEVIASVAIDRKTPVAVSTIKGEKIEALVGNQEFPEILRKTPSIYVTKEGGGFGDARINVRGFDQRNTAVMINGIPVNDMENGWVYWSNWAGLSDVTSTMQVQRGLGASKLAVPSVGGSINIITNAAEMRKGGAASVSIGNDGYQKYGLVLSTGLGESGWALTVQGTHTQGDGYVDGTKFRAYSYFASVSKVFNDNHTINATFLGAPQWHHQRENANRFDGGLTLRTFVDPDGNENSPRGIRFNQEWGLLNGEEFTWRRNFYHKPHANINHYWTINDKTSLKTSAYVSYGLGGGTGARGRMNNADEDLYFRGRIFDSFAGFGLGVHNQDGQVRWDDIVAYNQGTAIADFGDPDVDPGTTTSSGDGFIRRASMNYHNWYGIISNLDTKLSENLTFVGGLDARYYKGIHFRRLENLLGNSSYVARGDDNNPMNTITEPSPADFGNFGDNSYQDGTNVLNYWNDGLVSWLGLYGQLEYSTDQLTAFVSLSGSNQGFKRIDYFNYAENDTPSNDIDNDGEYRETSWENFLGGTIKAGLNYNINSQHNVFVNGGLFSRQPLFDNVFINFRNQLNENIENQKVYAVEAGYGLRTAMLRANLNLYLTQWTDRQFDQSVTLNNNETGLALFTGVAQTHSGVELEFTLTPVKGLDINGMASVGNWVFSNDFTARVTNTDTNTEIGTTTLFTDGLKVGDAAQTTLSLGANYEITRGLRVYADISYFDNLYANLDVTDDRANSILFEKGGEVVKLPAYNLVDAGASYTFDLGKTSLTLRLNVNNLTDQIYIAEMDTNIFDDPGTPRNELYDNRGFFGFGRTWNTGLKFRF